jgi:hypothetical protein
MMVLTGAAAGMDNMLQSRLPKGWQVYRVAQAPLPLRPRSQGVRSGAGHHPHEAHELVTAYYKQEAHFDYRESPPRSRG